MNKKIKICLPAALIPIAAVGVVYGFINSASAVNTTTGMDVTGTACSYGLTVPASVALTGASSYVGSAVAFTVIDTSMRLQSGGSGLSSNACGWTGGTGASLAMTITGTGFAGSPSNYDTLLSTAPLVVAPVATGCTANLGQSLSWTSSSDTPTNSGAFATLLHVGTTQSCTFSTTYSFTLPAGKTPSASTVTMTGPTVVTTNTIT